MANKIATESYVYSLTSYSDSNYVSNKGATKTRAEALKATVSGSYANNQLVCEKDLLLNPTAHLFTSFVSWNEIMHVSQVKYLVVGGGGGGAGDGHTQDVPGNGGNGGQVKTGTINVTPGASYNITCNPGSGGAGGSGNHSKGKSGSDGIQSSFCFINNSDHTVQEVISAGGTGGYVDTTQPSGGGAVGGRGLHGYYWNNYKNTATYNTKKSEATGKNGTQGNITGYTSYYFGASGAGGVSNYAGDYTSISGGISGGGSNGSGSGAGSNASYYGAGGGGANFSSNHYRGGNGYQGCIILYY